MTPMNVPDDLERSEPAAGPEEIMSALFANLVMQQAQTAYMLLGKVPHPETGQPVQDLESAKYFIDQLEMLAVKTKGNLDANERDLLGQSLSTLRLAYVEAIENRGGGRPSPLSSRPLSAPAQKEASISAPQRYSSPPSAASPAAPAPAPKPAAPAPAPAPEESRKKFSKTY